MTFCFNEGGVLLVMEWLHLPMQISTKPGYYQAMAKLRGRSDLMETSVINPFTETASGILADKSYAKLSYLALQSCKGMAITTQKFCSENVLERQAHFRIWKKTTRFISCGILFIKNLKSVEQLRLLLIFRFYTSIMFPTVGYIMSFQCHHIDTSNHTWNIYKLFSEIM